jgi:thiopeptide-type bacteriocin biosynthesis protein
MNYSPHTFITLRSPLYPFKDLFQTDVATVLGKSIFKEALYLSSPSLVEELEKYESKGLNENESEKLLLSVYRYYLRAAFRCTPFGLFAGISIGSISSQTNILLSPTSQYKKSTRLDTHFLRSFVQRILNDESARSELKWYTNNSAYVVKDGLRFIEYRIDKDNQTHHLAHVDNSAFIQQILLRAKGGATIAQLANVLVNEEISHKEAEEFIIEMIGSCLLVSELEPMVTGSEYHIHLLDKLANIPTARHYFQQLQSIVTALEETEKRGMGAHTQLYEGIVTAVKNWQIDFDPGRLFQCDMLKPTHTCQISTNVTDELLKAIRFLSRIAPAPSHYNLGKFIEAFEKRYESQEIPLLVVLDADTGIGYPANEQAQADNAPLIRAIQLGGEPQAETSSYSLTKWYKFLLGKYHEAINNKIPEIELTDSEIQPLEITNAEDPNTPDSVYTLCSILAASGSECDSGNFLIYHEATGGPSAANLIGRFCYLDEELTRLTRELLRQEEAALPDALFAEILHIPQARLANISMRPVLRNYEIPILTRPSVEENHTIPLHDLMVSVKNGRVFLRSKRLNKEVIPRLTTAHNFAINPVPHYHFLCDLQFQGLTRSLTWDWGLLNELSYVPRVRYRKTILAKARWRISTKDIFVQTAASETEMEHALRQHFLKRQIPNRVTISQGDNQLLVDIENNACLKILIKDLKKFQTIDIHECLFSEKNLLVTSAEGGYTNEVIIPWTRQIKPQTKTNRHTAAPIKIAVQRTFLPGDRWHYVKIYCGVKTADKILVDVVSPIAEGLSANNKIDKWFFIRYADPDHHLRVRFSGTDNFYAEVTEKLNGALKSYSVNNMIWKVQTDTYVRELERYGAAAIDLSETIFFHDSVTAIQILSLLGGDEGDDLRWQFALKGVNDLLESFGYGLPEKEEIMRVLSVNFKKEFYRGSVESKKQFGTKFRELRSKIDFALQANLHETHEYFAVWQLFEIRKNKFKDSVQKIDELYSNNQLEVQKSDLVASYVHMFLNRFLRSKQRIQEMVIYDLLHQHYKSILAREVKGISPNKPIQVFKETKKS